MKGKDFFSKLKEQGKIENEDFVKFIDVVPDFEIPDTAFSAFEENFLTRDRAKADSAIQSHYKAQVLNGVDQWVSDGVQNQMWPSSILDEKDTFKRLKMIKEDFKGQIERLKNRPADTDKDKKINDLTAVNETLTQKVNSLTSEYSTSKENLEKEYKKLAESLELDHHIREHIDQYNYADEHTNSPEKKRVLKKIILESIKDGNFFSLKDGQIKVWANESLTEPKFNGNSTVEFKTMLDKVVEPYLKKNNGAAPPQNQKPHQPAPVNQNSTLRQIRQAQ